MRRAMHRPRRGWTWVELIVVLAVVAVIASFTVSYVLQAREAQRRTTCRSHLKILGLALHNYHDTHKQFPPGFTIDPDGAYSGWAWGTMTLPYLDSAKLYSTISDKFSGGLQNAPAQPDYSTNLPGMDREAFHSCPSDFGSPQVAHTFVVTIPVTDGVVTPATLDVPNHFARSNYFGVVGYLHADVGGIAYDASGEPSGTPPLVNAGSLGSIGTTFSAGHRYCDPANFRGVFGQNSWTRVRDIKDGTSNTFIVGERYTPKNDGPHAVGHGTWVGVPDCSTAAGLAMALGDTAVELNAGVKRRAETTGFGSVHSGGGHFLFADGHVQFVAETIDIAAYRDLSTIADGRKPKWEP